MKVDKSSTAVKLLRRAEERLKNQEPEVKGQTAEADSQRLLHELQVLQIELEMQNEELRDSWVEVEAARLQYADMYDFAPLGYFTLRRNSTIIQTNLAGARLLGLERARLTSKFFDAFVTKADRPSFKAFLQRVFVTVVKQTCEVRLEKKDSPLLTVHIEATLCPNGQECRATVADITERKQMEEALKTANIELEAALAREQKLAHTDALTGINNRGYLNELAEHEFEIAIRYQQPLSVILFDLDHFKEVNDTFGHAAGDQILQRVTQVACAELRSADVIGRYGSDVFVILLPMTNAQQAYPLAERIRTEVGAIRMPTEKGNATIALSIGIVENHHSPKTGSVEDLLRDADAVMYTAKQAGCNRIMLKE